jgi:hypothetical protein
MPDVRESFSLDNLETGDLYLRYAELSAGLQRLPNGAVDPSAIEDDSKLQEMCVILAALRRRSAGPPKRGKTSTRARTKAPSIAPALDQL